MRRSFPGLVRIAALRTGTQDRHRRAAVRALLRRQSDHVRSWVSAYYVSIKEAPIYPRPVLNAADHQGPYGRNDKSVAGALMPTHRGPGGVGWNGELSDETTFQSAGPQPRACAGHAEAKVPTFGNQHRDLVLNNIVQPHAILPWMVVSHRRAVIVRLFRRAAKCRRRSR